MDNVKDFSALVVNEFRRRVFDESYPRIKQCINELSEEEIWSRPNENIVSVGNLVLHLCGNGRQWIVSGLGGEKDVRKRSSEFSERGPLPKAVLIENLRELKIDMQAVLLGLNNEKLTTVYKVQGFQESGLSILVHVIEHFSYHTGQITLHAKWLKNMDTGYYKGMQLE